MMSINKCMAAVARRTAGPFVDVDDVLLALFSEPDCRDVRHWPAALSGIRVTPPRNEVSWFIARAVHDRLNRPPRGRLPQAY